MKSKIDFPKISVDVLQEKEPLGIRLKILLQDSAESKVLCEEMFISQGAEGFNTKEIVQHNQNINLNLQCARDLFSINLQRFNKEIAEQLQLAVLKDGTVVCGESTLQSALNINVPTGLVVAGKVQSKNVNLTGRDLAIYNDIQATNISLKGDSIISNSGITVKQLDVTCKNKFVNQGIIECEELRIDGAGEIENENTVRSKNCCFQGIKLEGKEKQANFKNKGLFDACKLTLNIKSLENSGVIISESCKGTLGWEAKNSSAVVIHNSGTIAADRLSLKSKGIIINEKNAKICTEKKLRLYGRTQFNNFGEVSTKSLFIQSKYDLKNHVGGQLNCDHLLLSTIKGSLINEGLIITQGNAILTSGKDFINKGHCFVDGKLAASLSGQNQNDGVITAKNGIDVYAGSSEIFGKNSALLSQKRIRLKTLGKLSVSGEVKSHKDITTQSGTDTLIAKNASVTAQQKLTISSIKNTVNLGVLEGDTAYINAIRAFINGPKATLYGHSLVDILADRVKNSGTIKSKAKLRMAARSCVNQLLGSKIRSLREMSLHIQGSLINKGEIKSKHNLDVWAQDAIRNSGSIFGKITTLNSQCLFENLLTGIIIAGEQLNLFAKEVLENSGIFQSHGGVDIKSDVLLKNLKDGKVIATKDLILWAGYILSNAGKITGLGQDKVTLEAVHCLENTLTGLVSSEGELSVKSGYRLDNHGTLKGRNKLCVEALTIIHNYQTGKLQSNNVIDAISKWVFENDGELTSEGSLKTDVALILKNTESGTITAKSALELLNASIILNHGKITGEHSATLHARSLINNLKDGKIGASESLKLISEFSFENQGKLFAKKIDVEAKELLENSLTGQMKADIKLKLDTKGFILNQGVCHSGVHLQAHADAILNFSTGKITAKEAIELTAKSHIEQAGLVKAKTAIINGLTINNTGEIRTLQTLSMNIRDIFRHCKEGKITAADSVNILAKNLQMMGKLMVEGTINVEVDESFDYDSETLWAVGLLKLMLKQGYDFTNSLHVQGSLQIDSAKDIEVHNVVTATKDIGIKANNVVIEKNDSLDKSAGIYAGAKANIEANQTIGIGHSIANSKSWTKSDGSFVASAEGVTLKAGVIQNNLGEIYTTGDLVLEALHRIENSGNITASGKGKIISPLFEHKQLTYRHANGAVALSEKPTMTISGDCDVKGNVELLGANMHVGGKYTQKGDFKALSFEAFREWYDHYKVRGRRKGIGRGHRYHYYDVLRHQTDAVYDAQMSAGGGFDIKGKQFTNCGAFRTESLHAKCKTFENGTHTFAQRAKDDSFIDLKKYVQETALLGKAQENSGYVYGPKYSFRFNTPLAPMVKLSRDGEEINPVAENLFSPLIEKDMVQKALQDVLRTGYLDKDAGSPEEVLAQLRANTYQFYQTLKQPKLYLAKPGQTYSVTKAAPDGNCMFESCLKLIKEQFKNKLNHPIHQIENKQALRKWVCDHLHTRADTIREQVRFVMTGTLETLEESLESLPRGDFQHEVLLHTLHYQELLKTLGEKIANEYLENYIKTVADNYITEMRKDGIWGGDIELGMIAKLSQVNIGVHHAKPTLYGYQFERSAVPVGDNPNNPIINVVYTGGHYDALENAPPPKNPVLREQDLIISEKAMIFYQQQYYNGHPVLSPILFIPPIVRQRIALGNPGEAVLRANNAHLDGEAGSTATNKGKIKVDENLHVTGGTLNNVQRTHTVTKPVIKNKKDGMTFVAETQAMAGTGSVQAGSITGNLERLNLIGGEFASGEGGTHLVVRDGAL